jgi:hypothetical protein
MTVQADRGRRSPAACSRVRSPCLALRLPLPLTLSDRSRSRQGVPR